MTVPRALLLVPATVGLLLAAACSSDPEPATVVPTITATPAPSTTAAAGAPGSAAPIGPSGPTVRGTDADDVELADQTGDGSSVTIEEVDAAEAGWVAVVDPSGAVVGSAAVPAGESRGVVVTLTTPLTATQGITAQLHRDADGGAAFDAAVDPYVSEDGGDLVGDDARFTLG